MSQSLEAALDEERREIMALLEGRSAAKKAAASVRASSPAATQSPGRSMLDIDSPPSRGISPMLRHSSIAGQGVGVTSPPQVIRSMLDFDSGPKSPPMPTISGTTSAPTYSPPRINVEKDYNFDILPGTEQTSMPKRVSLGGKTLPTPRNTGIFGSVDSNTRSQASSAYFNKGKKKSQSPGLFGSRTKSPASRLNTNSSNLLTSPNTYVTDSGRVIDLNSAYRRLSDAALLRSGSSLAQFPTKKGADPSTGEQVLPDGSSRLTKDYLDEEDAVASSEGASDSSEEEDWASEIQRGRGRIRKDSNELMDDDDDYDDGTVKRHPKSLLGAADDERKQLIASTKVRSLLDDFYPSEDKIDGKTPSKRSGIHPRTAYDINESGEISPVDSEEEEKLDDIKQAQQLSMVLSQISSDPQNHRCIRQILRGNYQEISDEGAKGLRRQRLYMVATDLSEEAAYALEWTIGTVLKDGDTLLAVYAADISELSVEAQNAEKASKSKPTASIVPQSPIEQDAIEIGQGAEAFKDTAEIVRTLSNNSDQFVIRPSGAHLRAPSLTNTLGRSSSPGTAPASRSVSKTRELLLKEQNYSSLPAAERERIKATEAVTERCIDLLRKTKLQVRIVIDVVHCKSPRHMILEVIDYLEPTLVILGSRGRSAIKGVLLGSFSNYLVAKSSVPVMVARKKLKKQSKTFRRPKLSNVLSTGGSARLATAKIDKLISRSR